MSPFGTNQPFGVDEKWLLQGQTDAFDPDVWWRRVSQQVTKTLLGALHRTRSMVCLSPCRPCYCRLSLMAVHRF